MSSRCSTSFSHTAWLTSAASSAPSRYRAVTPITKWRIPLHQPVPRPSIARGGSLDHLGQRSLVSHVQHIRFAMSVSPVRMSRHVGFFYVLSSRPTPRYSEQRKTFSLALAADCLVPSRGESRTRRQARTGLISLRWRREQSRWHMEGETCRSRSRRGSEGGASEGGASLVEQRQVELVLKSFPEAAPFPPELANIARRLPVPLPKKQDHRARHEPGQHRAGPRGAGGAIRDRPRVRARRRHQADPGGHERGDDERSVRTELERIWAQEGQGAGGLDHLYYVVPPLLRRDRAGGGRRETPQRSPSNRSERTPPARRVGMEKGWTYLSWIPAWCRTRRPTTPGSRASPGRRRTHSDRTGRSARTGATERSPRVAFG